MLKNYFEIKVKYTKLTEDGKEKKVSETYIVNANNFSQAEMITNKKMGEITSQLFFIQDIKRSRITEVLSSVGEKYFVGTIKITNIDDKGKKINTINSLLIPAESVEHAGGELQSKIDEFIDDAEIKSIIESNIIDVWE